MDDIWALFFLMWGGRRNGVGGRQKKKNEVKWEHR